MKNIREATEEEVNELWMNPFGKQRDEEVIFVCEEDIRSTIDKDDLEMMEEFLKEDIGETPLLPIPNGFCDDVFSLIKDETFHDEVDVVYLAPLYNIIESHREDPDIYDELIGKKSSAMTYGLGSYVDDAKRIFVPIDHPNLKRYGLDDEKSRLEQSLISLFHEDGHFREYYGDESFKEWTKTSEDEAEEYGHRMAEKVLGKKIWKK